MARVKRAVGSKKHRKQVLERAKGYYGNKSRSFRAARMTETVPLRTATWPSASMTLRRTL